METGITAALPNLWLFGDSIIDNSYWNGVGAKMTSVVLAKLVEGKAVVKDRSTEELQAKTFANCLLDGNG